MQTQALSPASGTVPLTALRWRKVNVGAGERWLSVAAVKGELDPSFMLTHPMNLEDAPRGYELFKNKLDGCVRAVFKP